MFPVYGELDGTGEAILVTAGGDDLDLNRCAEIMRSLTPHVVPTADRMTLSVPLSWAAVTQLSHAFRGGEWGGQWMPGQRLSDWLIAEIIRRSCQGDRVGEPPKLDPMPHQHGGGVAIGMNGRFLLADDMGTGKGGTYLMGLAELDARGRQPWPALMVCPAGVVDTLLEEIPQWYPHWKAVAYRGTSRQRYLKSDARVLVMSYETMRNDTGKADRPGPLLKLKAGSVTYDECQALCNYDSLQSRQARRLAAHVPNVIAGSGTPITKNVASFWPVLNSMYPTSYPSRDRFKLHYCLSKRKDYGQGSDADVTGLNPAMEPEFRVAMQGVFRRIAKADVLTDLPPKTYQTRWLDIPPDWRRAYDQMEADMLAELPDVLTPLEVQSTLAKMTRLAQLASSACDVETWTETEGNVKSRHYGEEVLRTKVTLREPCWKGTALLGLLAELHQGEGELDDYGVQHGHAVGSRPCIAFAPSRQLVTLAGKMAERKGYKVGYITGAVKRAERNEARHAFQRNELDLICVTLGAGGAGLTLTAADTEAFLQRSFAYVPNAQAEDRAHRRGQTKNVQVVDFVARNTVESDVRAVLREKAGNLAELVQDRRIVESFLGGGRDRH